MSEPGHPDYYQTLAARIARETVGGYHINQFANPANPAAHEYTTGPEIWQQMEHNVDAIVCGVGSFRLVLQFALTGGIEEQATYLPAGVIFDSVTALPSALT